jgi:hypothetical protein
MKIYIFDKIRLGMRTFNRTINRTLVSALYTTSSTNGAINATALSYLRYSEIVGDKSYELSNHLGNVLVTVSDRKKAVMSTTNTNLVAYYEADIVTATDYYPFGMSMPGRTYSANSGYRYGFNGQEKSKEVNASGNSYTAEFWQYDSRIGRRWNVDPRSNVSISVYATFANNPVFYSDLRGDTINPENGFDKAAYRASLVEQKTLLEGYKRDGLPGGAEINRSNLNKKIAAFDAAIATFDALEKRKEHIQIRLGTVTIPADEGRASFDLTNLTPRLDLGTSIASNDFYLISHELQHVEDYFNGMFSFAADGSGGSLVDIHDEVGPNNRQEVLSSGIAGIMPNAKVWTASTLPEKLDGVGTSMYGVLPRDNRAMSNPTWSTQLKTATATSVKELKAQPEYYYGWEKDRAQALLQNFETLGFLFMLNGRR